MTRLIGIAGPMKTGKSTLAARLSQVFDLPVVSYAEAVRQEVSQAFFHKQQRAEARFLWDALESADKSLTRPILQAWGQGKRDLIGPDYWVNRLQEYVEKRGYEAAIVDDVRYANEAEHIFTNDGIMFRLYADEKTLNERGAIVRQHPSEDMSGLDEVLTQGFFPMRTKLINTSGRSPYGLLKAALPHMEEWF